MHHARPLAVLHSEIETPQDHYNELAYYTLAHPDPAFIHQHLVDVFAAQNATPAAKPIGVVFGLVGLYLHVERGFTGKEVQRAHMRMARQRRSWPAFDLPEFRGAITAADVLSAPAGPERDAAIGAWCESVWDAYRESQDVVRQLAKQELDVEP